MYTQYNGHTKFGISEKMNMSDNDDLDVDTVYWIWRLKVYVV